MTAVKDVQINGCRSCSQCEFSIDTTCHFCESNARELCNRHYREHLLAEHWDKDTEDEITRVDKAIGCSWHEGDDPLPKQSDKEYIPPGCQNCGTMYLTRDCVMCKREFLDWSNTSFDDVIAGPYITASGDLYCVRCGPQFDEEEEEHKEFDYDPDYQIP